MFSRLTTVSTSLCVLLLYIIVDRVAASIKIHQLMRIPPCGGSCGPYEFCDKKRNKCVCDEMSAFNDETGLCQPKCDMLNDRSCMDSEMCEEGTTELRYLCDKQSDVCCKEGCYGAPLCDETRVCASDTKQCECKSPATNVNGTCVTFCEDVPSHSCTDQNMCQPGTIQQDYQCEASSVVCCKPVYTIYEEELEWSEAKTYCENLGGHLAMFKSLDELKLFGSFIMNSLTQVSREHWIGIVDNGGTDYEFVDGTKVSDFFQVDTDSTFVSNLYWSSADGDGCMYAFHGSFGPGPLIDDDPCDDEKRFICQNVQ